MTAGARIATYSDGPAFMASMTGELQVLDGFLAVGGGPTVFRAGTVSWDGRALTYEGHAYELGDQVEVGGGFVELRTLRGVSAPPAWLDGTAFVVA